MQFLVRPFRRIIERGPAQPASEVTGMIEESAFLFSVDGARFTIPTLRCGEDERGRFALLTELEHVLDHGFRLVVECDPPDEPDGLAGCTIRLFKPHRNLVAMQQAYPDNTVLLPPESTLSIDFGPGGEVCGSGVMFRTPYPPDAPPPQTWH